MLRPIDIQNKEFDKRIKGYDKDQVDDFLDAVIRDFDALIKENQSLKDKLKVAEDELGAYRKMEKTLDDAVVVARESAAGIIANANTERENIIKRAKIDAQKLERQIDEEHMKRQQDIAVLSAEIDSYRHRLKMLCEAMMEFSEKI